MRWVHEHATAISRKMANVTRDSLDIHKAYVFVLIGGVIVISATGCRGKSRLPVAPVHGRVTYKGQGVPRANIIFFPADEIADTVKRLRPFGYTDDQGNFELKTYVSGDGAPFGKYRVIIIAPANGGAAKRGKEDPINMVSAAPGVNIPPAIVNKYKAADTSGIEVTVVEGENNLPPFAL